MKAAIANFFFFCMFCASYAQISDKEICDFDLQLVNALIESDQTQASHRKVLDLVKQNGTSISHDICEEENTYFKIFEGTLQLFTRSKSFKDREWDIAYTRYAYIAGVEEESQTFSDEDNAAYNIILDYIIAKYGKQFANVKRHMLSAAEQGNDPGYGFSSPIDALIEDLQAQKLSMTEGKPISETMEKWKKSWIELWIDTTAAPHESNYAWIQRAKHRFVEKYPNSEYNPAFEAMFNNKLMDNLVQNEIREKVKVNKDKNRHVTGALGVMVGKPFFGSNMEPIDDNIAVSVPHFRLQIIHFVAQLQGDMYLGGDCSSMGLEGLFGYNFEFGSFGIDLLAGIGFNQFFMGTDTTWNRTLLAGVQGFKRIYMAAVAAFTPKIQWTIKEQDFKSPLATRKRTVFVNQFYLGATLEFIFPLD